MCCENLSRVRGRCSDFCVGAHINVLLQAGCTALSDEVRLSNPWLFGGGIAAAVDRHAHEHYLKRRPAQSPFQSSLKWSHPLRSGALQQLATRPQSKPSIGDDQVPVDSFFSHVWAKRLGFGWKNVRIAPATCVLVGLCALSHFNIPHVPGAQAFVCWVRGVMAPPSSCRTASKGLSLQISLDASIRHQPADAPVGRRNQH